MENDFTFWECSTYHSNNIELNKTRIVKGYKRGSDGRRLENCSAVDAGQDVQAVHGPEELYNGHHHRGSFFPVHLPLQNR